MSAFHSWPAAINATEPEGRSVWKYCPFPRGSRVYLTVLTLPKVALRIGQDMNNQAVNGPLLTPGPWPGSEFPITVGCDLYVVPAYRESTELEISADNGAPTDGSKEGIDVRILQDEVDPFVSVWANGDGADSFTVQPWVQNTAGRWAKQPDTGGPIGPFIQQDQFRVDVRDAVRLYTEVVFLASGTPTVINFGRLSAPGFSSVAGFKPSNLDLVVRFGAVMADVTKGAIPP